MNRRITKSLMLATIIAWLGSHSFADAQVASIGGTIYEDLNANTLMDSGEGIAGVALQLYLDDGDGIYNASLDSMSAEVTTDIDGLYAFAGLNMDNDYFVVQDAQIADGRTLLSSVSSLLEPVTHTLMVDSFTDQQLVQGDPIRPIGSTNLASPSGVLGGQRDLFVEFLSGPAEATWHAFPYGFDQVLQLDQSAGVVARALVTWDGIDLDMSPTPASGGLGGLDFTNSEAFMFDLGVDRAGAGETLIVRIFSGDDVSEAAIVLPVTNGTAIQTQIVPFSSFAGDASFASVDAIQIELGGNMPSIDAQIGPIELISGTSADFAVHAVPEPTTQMLGFAAFGFLLHLLRRRRRS